MYWKKKILSSTYEIYSQDTQKGWLRDNIWKGEAHGELLDRELKFKSKGVFKSHTDIINAGTGEHLGQIRYNTWMTRADISLEGKKFLWKYDNSWQTRWSITMEDGMQIRYSGNEIKGRIEGLTDNPAALLTGLFATTYNWQITLIVIFVPLFIILFT